MKQKPFLFLRTDCICVQTTDSVNKFSPLPETHFLYRFLEIFSRIVEFFARLRWSDTFHNHAVVVIVV